MHDDGTTSNEDRLGAIGDIRFAIEHGGLAGDDLLVIAADNLFEFSLADYVAFWRGKGEGARSPCTGSPTRRSRRLYGVVELDADDRVVGLEEKPERPAQRSRLDRDVSLLTGRSSRCSTGTSTRATRPTRPGGS